MATKKKNVPTIQIPTVSFYSHRGRVNEMAGSPHPREGKPKVKGPFLSALTEHGTPILARDLLAEYPSNRAVITIAWEPEETQRLSPAEFAALGYPISRSYMFWSTMQSVLDLGQYPSIIDAQRAIMKEVAQRFRVTTVRPTPLLFLFGEAMTVKQNSALAFEREGGYAAGHESGKARVEIPTKKKEETIPFILEYAVRGPDAAGVFTYHAAYYPEDLALLGAVPGMPGELFEDAYFLTLMQDPTPSTRLATARGLAENVLRQAVPYITAAIKSWDGMHHGLTPRFYRTEEGIRRV